MKYRACDRCGCHIDYGETCDCEKERDAETEEATAGGKEEEPRAKAG